MLASTDRSIGTIPALLAWNSDRGGSSVSMLSEASTGLSHAQVWKHVEATARKLKQMGIGRGDRVAMVLPQGPVLALAFLSVASCATAAPLNPAYLEKECLFYLEDLSAKALLLLSGVDSPARKAAAKLGIPVVDLVPEIGGGGCFEVVGSHQGAPLLELAGEEDVALVLHTSGTTSRPKMVPLTHRNLLASARHISSTVSLGTMDRCLNVMPLFHIHGLVAGLLAPLWACGSTVCTRSFDAGLFMGWLNQWNPTWFTCVPTMHQAILAHVGGNASEAVASSLRFIRSSSAALPPTVMLKLEAIFGVPVIESYGMTEAAHQMASNPLPPRMRKPGSVGLAAGPEVTILDEAGIIVANGGVGEIAIRGANVTLGYVNNPSTNATAFTNGWFRTGDQGYLDSEGYLFITGRLKELVNRGGEKVAPREIDDVLLTYPGVRQAVAFAVPHASLGEDIAAAVVMEAGVNGDESAMRGFALDRLPAFKVPSRILFVPDIPKGPTGKIQRIGMAERMAAYMETTHEPAETEVEAMVASVFGEVLGRNQVGRSHNFFAMGGDSLRVVQVVARLGQMLGFQIPLTTVFRFPTPALLAKEVTRLNEPQLDDLVAELEQLSPEERDRILGDLSR